MRYYAAFFQTLGFPDIVYTADSGYSVQDDAAGAGSNKNFNLTSIKIFL